MAVNDILEREERPAYVRFEKRAVEDKPESLKQGKVVYKDINFVLVTPPYSKDCFEQKVELWFDSVEQNVRNNRTPKAWLEMWRNQYDQWMKGEETPLNGTSVKNWSAITPAQVKTILRAGIYTIEDLALANDEGVRRLGMGGVDLKNKAKAYVQAAKDTGPLVMENAALKKENDQLAASLKSLEDKVAILQAKSESNKTEETNVVEIGRDEINVGEMLEEINGESLAEQYEKKFGKKPHHLMKEETIRQKLES